MLRTSLLLILVVYLAAIAITAQSTAEEVLPAGTLLQCTLDEPNFSSRTAEIGDPVLCHIGALDVFGRSVFPRGAYLAGHFRDYRDPGHFFGKGWMALTFDRLVLPDAVTLPLSAKIISAPPFRVDQESKIRGRGHPKRDAIGWALPILWPVKLLTLPARGPRPTLKGESHITLRVLEDVEVPATTVASRNPSPIPRARQFSPSSQDTTLPRLWRDYRTQANNTSAVLTTPEPTRVVGSSYLADSPPGQLTILMLKDNTSYAVTDYWLEGTRLHCLTLDGTHKVVPLGRLDLDETVRLNQERSLEIVLRFKEE
jgi:hypothetical protein